MNLSHHAVVPGGGAAFDSVFDMDMSLGKQQEPLHATHFLCCFNLFILLSCCSPHVVKCLRGPRMKVHLHIFTGAMFDLHNEKKNVFFSSSDRNLMVSLYFFSCKMLQLCTDFQAWKQKNKMLNLFCIPMSQIDF